LYDIDQTLGDGVTSDNTTKDVDKDCCYLGIAGDQLEGGSDGFWRSTTTDIQEVSRRTTVELDDVHGSHGKTCAVDQAADITIELDEVESVSG
jgi:hypothetical protein